MQLSIVKLLSEFDFSQPQDLRERLIEVGRRIERFVNSDNRIIIYNDAKKHFPTKLKRGDIILDTVANPGYITISNWDGKKKNVQPISSASIPSKAVYSEIPTGNTDGSNVSFIVRKPPTLGTSRVFLNGQRKTLNVDYVESATGFKFNIPPPVGSNVLIDYNTQ